MRGGVLVAGVMVLEATGELELKVRDLRGARSSTLHLQGAE